MGDVVGGFTLQIGDDIGGLDVEKAVGAALEEVPVVEVGLEDFIIGGVNDRIGF